MSPMRPTDILDFPLTLTIDWLDPEPLGSADTAWDDQEVEVSLAGVVLWRTCYDKKDSMVEIRDSVATQFAEKIARLLSFESALQAQDRY